MTEGKCSSTLGAMIRSAKKIHDIIDSLPEEKQQEILDFAEYLHFREIERGGLTVQIVESIKQVKNKKVRSARDLVNDL